MDCGLQGARLPGFGGVQGGVACEVYAQRVQTVASTHGSDFQGRGDHLAGLGQSVHTVQRNAELVPAHDIQRHEPGLHLAVRHGDKFAALGPGFIGVAALQVAGKDDAGRFADHRAGVDMAQRPVVVALGFERGDVGGGVSVMAVAAH